MKYSVYHYSTDQGDLADVAMELCRTRGFTETSSLGFQLDSVQPDEVRFKFIVKDEIDETIEDPFGNTTTQRRIVYDVSLIRVIRAQNIIQLVNPGRKARRFLKVINKESEKSITLIRLTPDFARLLRIFDERFKGMVISSLETKQFLIKGRTSCVVRFKALVDVKDDYRYFLNERDPGISYIAGAHKLDGRDSKFEVYESGRIVVDASPLSDERNLLIEAVLDSIEG